MWWLLLVVVVVVLVVVVVVVVVDVEVVLLVRHASLARASGANAGVWAGVFSARVSAHLSLPLTRHPCSLNPVQPCIRALARSLARLRTHS